jgi:hypothetical protein
MELWVGPAIVAAAISSLIGILSLYLNALLTIRMERARRMEKVRDVQIALLSEIRAEIHNLGYYDLDQDLQRVRQKYDDDANYIVRPSLGMPLLLEDLLKREVQILPAAAIDPVFLYIRQKAVTDQFAEDMRGEDFSIRGRSVQLYIY